MSEFVKIAFNLDRVLGGKYAGRALMFTNGVELHKQEQATMEIEFDGFDPVMEGDILVYKPVKRVWTGSYTKETVVTKEGFEPVRDKNGAVMGFLRVEDGGARPSDTEIEAMRDEVRALPERLDPAEQRIRDLESQVEALMRGGAAVLGPG
jgi:hypothetical protein